MSSRERAIGLAIVAVVAAVGSLLGCSSASGIALPGDASAGSSNDAAADGTAEAGAADGPGVDGGRPCASSSDCPQGADGGPVDAGCAQDGGVLAGTWEGHGSWTSMGAACTSMDKQTYTVVLSVMGNTVTGTMKTDDFSGSGALPVTGTASGNTVTFSLPVDSCVGATDGTAQTTFSCTACGDQLDCAVSGTECGTCNALDAVDGGTEVETVSGTLDLGPPCILGTWVPAEDAGTGTLGPCGYSGLGSVVVTLVDGGYAVTQTTTNVPQADGGCADEIIVGTAVDWSNAYELTYSTSAAMGPSCTSLLDDVTLTPDSLCQGGSFADSIPSCAGCAGVACCSASAASCGDTFQVQKK